ncbi:MAG: sigma-70 family RNA polymerase sigma factor [Sedimentisphaerales bacterium]|nr:sigma-70 family RNA polymerase sigma factor [Sedimentisphaerales bacterium]
MQISENLLLKQFSANGDAEAFAEIAREHAPLVYGVCLRILEDRDTAADVVQDTFLQLVRNADTITGSLPNWLHRVAKNRAIKLIRQNSSRKQREKIYSTNSEIDSCTDTACWQEISGVIDEELDQLDDLTREVLILHFFENQTMTTIAEKFEISQPTVSRRIESGIDSLRKRLKSRGIIVSAAILTALLTENIVQAAPASIMKELGKIALSGGTVATGVKVAAGLSVIKTKLIAIAIVTIIGGSAAWHYNYNRTPKAINTQQTNITLNSGLFLDQNPLDTNLATIVVIDQFGNNLSGVKVTDTTNHKEYFTDENGQFTCEIPDELIHFNAIEKKRKLVNSGRLNPGQRYLLIELKPGRVVSGEILNSENEPVSNTIINVVGGSSVSSDSEGKFILGWLPEWEPQSGICLWARNYEQNLAAVEDISIQAESINIKLAPAFTLKGTVTNPEGVPLSGVKMWINLRKWRWGSFFVDKSIRTDEKGQFEFSTLPQFQEYELNLEAENYLEVSTTIGLLNSKKDTVRLEPIVLYPKQDTSNGIEYGQLFLSVFDENNKAIDITEVHIGDNKDYFQRDAKSFIVTSTDKPGFYKIENIPVGYHPFMSIDVPGYALFQQTDVIIEKDNPKTINCILKKGGMIEGQVANDKGEPVEGMPVKIKSVLYVKDLKTNKNGRFSADHMPDMRYSVVAEPPSENQYATTVFVGDVTCGRKDINIVLQNKKETKRKAASLIGKNILQFDEIKIDLDENKIKDKYLLLCFFDIEQRPSRSALIELNKKLLELKIQNVVVAAVQVSILEDDLLNEWLEENDITFQVGKFQGRDETLSNWGVTAQPWLILTDKNHVVTDEGFSITELDGKINIK